MLRHTILALTLGLTLVGIGITANAQNNAGQDQKGAQQPAPAAGDTQQPQPNQADPNAQPANPAPANPGNQVDPNAPQTNPAPDPNAPANPAQPNPGTPGQPQPNQQPPDQNQNNLRQPDQNPSNQNPVQQTPGQPAQSGNMGAGATGAGGTPLHQFLSQQVDEVGMLSDQMDVFRAAKRQDAVMAMYHMIRDHRLVADAAQNVLARRGDVSRPTLVSTEPSPQDPQEIIRQQIQHHEQALSQTQQLLSDATTPEERSIYQRAVDATNKHLVWLRAMDQGQPLRIGFFGPTVPLARIAGYRQQSSVGQGFGSSGRTQQARRPNRHRRGWASRRANRRGMAYSR
jgi:hypothetical protein